MYSWSVNLIFPTVGNLELQLHLYDYGFEATTPEIKATSQVERHSKSQSYDTQSGALICSTVV